jgi:hypothetical protein
VILFWEPQLGLKLIGAVNRADARISRRFVFALERATASLITASKAFSRPLSSCRPVDGCPTTTPCPTTDPVPGAFGSGCGLKLLRNAIFSRHRNSYVNIQCGGHLFPSHQAAAASTSIKAFRFQEVQYRLLLKRIQPAILHPLGKSLLNPHHHTPRPTLRSLSSRPHSLRSKYKTPYHPRIHTSPLEA